MTSRGAAAYRPKIPSTLAFAARPLPIRGWTAPLVRVHRLIHGPVYFGRTAENRFDDPHREYGVLYGSDDLEGAYLETVRLEAVPGKPLPVGPTEGWLFARAWSRLTVKRELRLVDLAAQQKKLRIAGEVMSGTDYDVSRAWSRELYQHRDRADGILYRARHNQERLSIALFDRGEELVALEGTYRFDEDLDHTLDLLLACDHLPVPDDDR